jgi:hypothetical protein
MPDGELQRGIEGRDRRPGPGCGTARSRSMPPLDCRQEWRMELDPRQVPIIVAIGTGICVGLVGYLAYLLFSILATA